ncbi:hypothetical protein VA7868_03507 [Vibrio aerogenes CECT 7868]|uniref:Uncharacterized protein n=1 Tax=Vibrio aerogenes CECT 7868 TaxID=1216006 RepID=A0A1M6A7Y3_9VIBR|nr:hypothetical protein [Vibrio aerogenes]SHI32624.1 hypothetical protein VA7868_03507 [Vibrio aerogenes CECT 7868]
MDEDDKNKRKPTLINIGNAKIKNLQIEGLTISGDIDGIKGDSPEIGNAKISRITHIKDDNLSSQHKAQLIHCLNVAMSKSPELVKDVETLQKFITSGEGEQPIIEMAKTALVKFAVKSRDNLLKDLINIIFGE